ncbi:recombinase family protein [Bradyrhizobium sp. URHC0002]
MITKVGRIARSVRDLWNILHEVIDEKGAQSVSLRESWCDTATPAGKLMITVLGGVARVRARIDSGAL